jgi:hypothetical protein
MKNFFLNGRIPLLVKLLFTAFVAVLVPVYLANYGPTNFLYFCDVALLLTLLAIWTESSLLASAPLAGIMIPQLLWMTDFFCEAVGVRFTGLTSYMFNSQSSLFLRGLSFFHFWLPWLLVYMVSKLGYDRRAWLVWTMLGWELLLVCFLFMPEPRPSPGNLPVNINYVYGFDDEKEQTSMDRPTWFFLEVNILTFGIWLSTHLVFCKLFPAPTPTPLPARISSEKYK